MTLHYDAVGTVPASGPQPGAKALRDRVVAKSAGEITRGEIYANRPVRGKTTLSVHAEGRAIDFFTKAPANDFGTFLAGLLTDPKIADFCGIQFVVWNHRKWNVKDQTWKPYSGVDPHTSHVHVEINWDAAKGPNALTAQKFADLDAFFAAQAKP